MKNLDFDVLNDHLEEGKPGFVKFQNKEDQLHYFKYHGQSGQVFFFSHPHHSAKNRNSALRNVKKYLMYPEHYKVEQEEGHWYFSLRSGNNREFARSLPFPTKEELEEVMDELQSDFAPPPEVEEQTQESKEPQQPKAIERKPEEKPSEDQELSRFNFDLTFYRQADGEKLIGKIEYPLHKSKETFEGLDLTKLGQFIKRYLPKEELPKKTASVEEKTSGSAPLEVNINPPPDFRIHIREKGKVMDNYLHLNQPASLAVQLVYPQEQLARADAYNIVVSVKSFGRQRRAEVLGRKDGRIPPNMEIEIPLNTDNLNAGVYYINFELQLWAGAQPDAKQLINGSRTIQLLKSWAEVLN